MQSLSEKYNCSNQQLQIISHNNLNNFQETKAAIIVQSVFRRHLVNKSFLPQRLYSKYYIECENIKKFGSNLIPQAENGSTRVYFPPKMPKVVLKQFGRNQAIQRFHQKEAVRSILNSQGSTNLILPRARLCDDFLVEDRLPINVETSHNKKLYISQPELFNQAIRELTRLFSRLHMDDLLSVYSFVNNSRIKGVEDIVRYDNLPLYIVEENGKECGKIGLIDIDNFVTIYEEPSFNKGLNTLVRIFPLHIKLIKEEAINGGALESEMKYAIIHNKKNCMVDLEFFAEKGKKYLQIESYNYIEWLKQQGISTKNPFEPLKEITSERRLKLITVLKEELLKLNLGVNELFTRKSLRNEPLINFLVDKTEDVIEQLSQQLFTLILDNIKNEFSCQKEQFKQISDQCFSESQMINLRSLSIRNSKICQGMITLLKKNMEIERDYPFRFIVEQLAYIIIEEMQKGGEIFFFESPKNKNEIFFIQL